MNNSYLACSGLENEEQTRLSKLQRTSANFALMASNLSFSWTALATLFLSKGSETKRVTVGLLWTFHTAMLMLNGGGCGLLLPINCIPSTHMNLLFHSLELFLGNALASRTEITCLSQLQDKDSNRKGITLSAR